MPRQVFVYIFIFTCQNCPEYLCLE